jgi:hypothetical protein
MLPYLASFEEEQGQNRDLFEEEHASSHGFSKPSMD